MSQNPTGMTDRVTGPTDRSSAIDTYDLEREQCLTRFARWSQADQIDFVQHLLHQMCHYQHGLIDTFLKPMLQRDFLSLLPKSYLDHIAEKILSYLDARSLAACEAVCREWNRVICDGMLWKKLIERQVKSDALWKGLSERRGWHQFLFKCKPGPGHCPNSRGFLNFQTPLAISSSSSFGPTTNHGAGLITFNQSFGFPPDHTFYHRLYPTILRDISNLESNWRLGKHALRRIRCRSENSKGVYCLQYDDHKIVSGLRDNTIKIWDFKTLECLQILTGHTGSVLCLQYDERIIVTGSSDATVRIWDVNTGEMLNTLIHHCEAVLHLRFEDGVMVTCSKDRSIAVWDMQSPTDITLRRVLVGHRAAVNVVDFDQKYIVSASGDRTIKVWDTSSCEFIRTLNGHKRGIACLQYRERLIVSGSSDYTIRLWDIECGACLRILEGHEELVRCIRFDNKRIVSGAYDGKIKVWDLAAALDPRTPPGSVCVRTLVEHTGRVFRLQFDEFQIVSSSHDDTILVWDFLNYECPAEPLGGLQTGPEDDSNPPIDDVITPLPPRTDFQDGGQEVDPQTGMDNTPSTPLGDGAHVVSSHPSLARALRSSIHPAVAMEEGECQGGSATTFVNNCTAQPGPGRPAQNASIASFANGFTRASLTPNLELPYQGPQIQMVGTSCATYSTNFFRQPSLSVTSQQPAPAIPNTSASVSAFDMFRRQAISPLEAQASPGPPLEDMTLDALGTDLEQLEEEEGSSP